VVSAATLGGSAKTTSGSASASQASAPAAAIPFIRASAEHREPLGLDISRTLLATDQDLSVFDVPAYGYVRALVLLVTATGGVGTGVVANEDAPWNVIKNIALTEPNGAQISQFNSGYDLYLANKWGGYRPGLTADPRNSPVYSPVSASGGNFQFMVRIPVEINLRDGLGSLPNQNAAATFKLRLALAGSAAVYSTAPGTTLPTVRVQGFLEAWDQPEQATGGAVNATTPPAMNTTQFWTTQVLNYSAGQQTLRLSRVGNYIRNIILIGRRSGSRSNGDADFPNPLTVQLDTRPLDIVERNNWKNQMFERTEYGAAGAVNDAVGGLDNGVFVYDFMHEFDGFMGRENRDLWLPTLPSTRLELQGTFANAGTLTVLTNDVAVAGNVFI